MAQWLFQAKRKQRNHRDNCLIREDAQDRISRPDHARPQQGTRRCKKRCVRGNELVQARKPDHFVHRGFGFPIALNLVEECLNPRSGPKARQLIMFERLRR